MLSTACFGSVDYGKPRSSDYIRSLPKRASGHSHNDRNLSCGYVITCLCSAEPHTALIPTLFLKNSSYQRLVSGYNVNHKTSIHIAYWVFDLVNVNTSIVPLNLTQQNKECVHGLSDSLLTIYGCYSPPTRLLHW